MKKILLSVFMVLFISDFTSAQLFDQLLASRLQNTLDSIRNANNIKGMSACVIYPGMGTWNGVTGISHPGVPVTPDMEFGIASNTKLFTGVLMLKLAENNIINLDDSLFEYLPTFNNIDSNITIRQLLNHTSGLADVNDVTGYSDSILTNPNRIFTPAELMTWVDTPLFAPATGWGYCNTNYLLAGMIAEAVTGQTYGHLLHDSILSPLQLDSTFLDVYDSVLYTIAHPWQGGNNNILIPRKSLNSASWSAGAMYSTSGEMAQWYQSLMNGQVLTQASMNELTTFVGSGNYGIGLYETTIPGRTVWQHGGSIWGGYNSSMIYDTASGIVICVLINQNPSQAFLFGRQLLSAILNNPVGVTENSTQENRLIVYPNPASEMVVVELPQEIIRSIQLFSQSGKLLKETLVTKIDVSDLPAGMYFVKVFSEERCYQHKLIRP